MFKPRHLTLTVLVLTFPLLIALLPILLVASVIVDLATGLTKLPTARLVLFGVVYIIHQLVGCGIAGWLWLTGRFGRRLDVGKHRTVQWRWIGSLFIWARRLLNVHLDISDFDSLPPGHLVLYSRHASMVDAAFPLHMVVGHLKRPVHYVLKRELIWDPCLGTYGDRLNNHFVDRGGDTEREVAALKRMAETAEEDSVLVIFPEGTYATESSRARVLASLERKGETLAVEQAKKLDYLLPPKPAGALALLESKPDAHVVFLGHVGLEGIAQLKGLRRSMPLEKPVTLRWWVVERSTIPTERLELERWLAKQWEQLDQWVDQHTEKPNIV